MSELDGQNPVSCAVATVLGMFWARVDRIVPESPADLFTDDGQMLLGIVDAQGRPAIASYFAARSDDEIGKGRHTRHILANLWFERVSADGCDLHSLICVYSGVGLVPLPSHPPSTIADFRYRMVRTDAGWRIAWMKADPVFLGAGALAATR